MTAPHEHYMQMALREARKAAQMDEVPVGAVLVDPNGDVIASAFNQVVSLNDPTAHAEILAIRKAAQRLKNYRLLKTALYVTIEPCAMCMGAVIHARLERVVYGAPDPKWGAAGSLYNFCADGLFNHRPQVVAGVCQTECRLLIQRFFKDKRLNAKLL